MWYIFWQRIYEFFLLIISFFFSFTRIYVFIPHQKPFPSQTTHTSKTSGSQMRRFWYMSTRFNDGCRTWLLHRLVWKEYIAEQKILLPFCQQHICEVGFKALKCTLKKMFGNRNALSNIARTFIKLCNKMRSLKTIIVWSCFYFVKLFLYLIINYLNWQIANCRNNKIETFFMHYL